MVARDTHLVLIRDERVPSNVLDRFCLDIEADSLEVHRATLPPRGFQAGSEILFVFAVALFLLKPYFDGFLQEAGRDHYIVLKKAIKSTWSHFFGKPDRIRMVKVTADGVEEAEHSFSFSIYAEIDGGRKVKLLFPEDCSEDPYGAAIDAFLELLECYHLGVRGAPARISLDDEKEYFGHVLLEFDPKTRSLRVLDPISHSKNRKRGRPTDE